MPLMGFQYDESATDLKKLKDVLDTLDRVRDNTMHISILRKQDNNKCNALMIAAKCGSADQVQQVIDHIQGLANGGDLLKELAKVKDMDEQAALALANSQPAELLLQDALPVAEKAVAAVQSEKKTKDLLQSVWQDLHIVKEFRSVLNSPEEVKDYLSDQCLETLQQVDETGSSALVQLAGKLLVNVGLDLFRHVIDFVAKRPEDFQHDFYRQLLTKQAWGYYDDFYDDDVGRDNKVKLLALVMLHGNLEAVNGVVKLLSRLPDNTKLASIESQLTDSFGFYGNPLSLVVTRARGCEQITWENRIVDSTQDKESCLSMIEPIVHLLKQLPEPRSSEVLLKMLQHSYEFGCVMSRDVETSEPAVFVRMAYFDDLSALRQVFSGCVYHLSDENRRKFESDLLPLVERALIDVESQSEQDIENRYQEVVEVISDGNPFEKHVFCDRVAERVDFKMCKTAVANIEKLEKDLSNEVFEQCKQQLVQIVFTAVRSGDSGLLQRALAFVDKLPAHEKSNALDYLFTEATFSYDDRYFNYDTEDDTPIKILATAICHGQLASFVSVVQPYLKTLDSAARQKYVSAMLSDDIGRSDPQIRYQSVFVFVIKQIRTTEQRVKAANLLFELAELLPLPKRVRLLSETFTRQLLDSSDVNSAPNFSTGDFRADLPRLCMDVRATTLMQIVRDEPAVFRVIIDRIHSLPAKQSVTLLRHVLSKKDKQGRGVSDYALLARSGKGWKRYVGLNGSIYIPTLPYVGGHFIACLKRLVKARKISDDTLFLWNGLCVWLRSGWLWPIQRQVIVNWFGASATREQKKCLAQMASKSKLYKQCDPKGQFISRSVAAVSVLAGGSAGNGTELKLVTRKSFRGGGGRKSWLN